MTLFLTPFDVMRSNRALAPHDAKLNDIRWLVGETLRRTHQRGYDRFESRGVAIHLSDVTLHARAKLRKAEDRAGPAAWPILTRIVIEGAGVRECRGFIPELATPWRADAVVTDRLRVALDAIGPIMGVTKERADV